MRVAVTIVAVLLASPACMRRSRRGAGAKARMLYNAADYDGAIAAAVGRPHPAWPQPMRRRSWTPARTSNDIAAPPTPPICCRPRGAQRDSRRDALAARPGGFPRRPRPVAAISADLFGPAADLFDTALERGALLLPDHDRLMLLDWWATALDREAQAAVPERPCAASREDYRAHGRGASTRSGQRARELLASGCRARRREISIRRGMRRSRRGFARRSAPRRPSRLRADIDRLVIRRRSFLERAALACRPRAGGCCRVTEKPVEPDQEQWK